MKQMNLYKIWVGKNPIPEIFKQYTDTWDKAGCKIVDVGNDDIKRCLEITESKSLKWAVLNKNYAVINHYLRYWLLHRYGGVYMDLDVQVVKPIDFEGVGVWIGMESERWINNCVMVASLYHPFFMDCMMEMDKMDMEMKEIELETGPRLVSNLIQRNTTWHPKTMTEPSRYWYKHHQVTVLPCRYFSPHRWNQTFDPDEIVPDTYTVHHYCHSWK